MKKLFFIRKSHEIHWVGDGFPVRNIFSYEDIAEKMSPFLLLDYIGPANFLPTQDKRGVGEHPHRGIETVTLVYQGEVEHRDSSGGGGKVGPNDVQWMTAASGLVHEEFHGSGYASRGGILEVVQLWVNLPKKSKMSPPGYQGISSEKIPRIELSDEFGFIRVIAGEYEGQRGPARTLSPMNVWDLRLNPRCKLSLQLKEGDTTALFVLKGQIRLSSGEIVDEAELAVLERQGQELSFEVGKQGSTLLLLSGKPLNEPIVASGPFVMNSEDEIKQAYLDYQSGQMGRLALSKY